MNIYARKRIVQNIFLFIISGLFLFCSSPIESNTNDNSTLEKDLKSFALEDLSPEEIEGLIFMREEEKLARDVYIKMYEEWNIGIFNNISQSEQRHMDALKVLLDRYELEDPIVNDEVGIFNNEKLLNLYNSLILQGNDSLQAALKVGAAIEEIDILDLEQQINDIVDNEDVLLVYNNLLRGSRNHLRAFVRNIGNQGEIYVPQYMEVTSYEEIIASDMERGGKGRRSGNAKGKGKRGNSSGKSRNGCS